MKVNQAKDIESEVKNGMFLALSELIESRTYSHVNFSQHHPVRPR
jgi:hypothetical protein